MVIHLGAGGFGNVYEHEGKAVKIMRDVRNGIWCYNEICISNYLSHPNILSPQTAYIYDGSVRVVMDKADCDLKRWRSENTPDHIQILQWTIHILSALSYMHRQDVYHCDIKASNILLFGKNVKLADFSLSRKRGHLLSLNVCTYFNRPPEYWSDSPPETGYWIDIWALGCTIYYLIRGKPMFKRCELSDKLARKLYYNRVYNNYARDYKRLQTSDSITVTNLLSNILTLMLNPDYTARPTAESLLRLIWIRLRKSISVPRIKSKNQKHVRTYCPFEDRFTDLICTFSIKIHPEILRLGKQIATGFSKIHPIDSDSYLITILWIASKIVLNKAYEPKALGLSRSTILRIEQKICNISRFKLCII